MNPAKLAAETQCERASHTAANRSTIRSPRTADRSRRPTASASVGAALRTARSGVPVPIRSADACRQAHVSDLRVWRLVAAAMLMLSGCGQGASGAAQSGNSPDRPATAADAPLSAVASPAARPSTAWAAADALAVPATASARAANSAHEPQTEPPAEPQPLSGDEVEAPLDEAAAIAAYALEAGFGDPLAVDIPPPEDAAAVAAVGLVTETAPLFIDNDTDCVAVAQRLERLGSPRELLQAVQGIPDEATSQTLAALHSSILIALSACGQGTVAAAEHAWQWAVAHKRLRDVGVIN